MKALASRLCRLEQATKPKAESIAAIRIPHGASIEEIEKIEAAFFDQHPQLRNAGLVVHIKTYAAKGL
jgi:hypothetical protein